MKYLAARLAVSLLVVVFIIMVIWSFGGGSRGLFGDRKAGVRRVFEEWERQNYVDVTDRAALRAAIESIEIRESSGLTPLQRQSLRASIAAFMSGLSGGGFQEYSRFQFPVGINLNRELVLQRVVKPMPANPFPRLIQDRPRPILEHPIVPIVESQARTKTDFELAAEVMNRSSGGALENPFVEGFCAELSEIAVRSISVPGHALSDRIQKLIPSAGSVGIRGIDLSHAHTNTSILSLPPLRSFAEYVEEQGRALTADVILMLNFISPDHAGPVGIALYWLESDQCWIPYNVIQVGFYQETGMAIPF